MISGNSECPTGNCEQITAFISETKQIQTETIVALTGIDAKLELVAVISEKVSRAEVAIQELKLDSKDTEIAYLEKRKAEDNQIFDAMRADKKELLAALSITKEADNKFRNKIYLWAGLISGSISGGVGLIKFLAP